MTRQKEATDTALKVEITARPKYIAEQSDPDRSIYFFSYKIHVRNESPIAVQILSRHWIITDGLGRIDEVRGPGVVGQQPWIASGESFEYESFCPLSTPTGTMKGTLTLVSSHGMQFTAPIAEFFLIEPNSFH